MPLPVSPESIVTQRSPKLYRVGTLEYTFRGVIVLFLWLLWGDFAMVFFTSIFGNFIPLYLKDLNASNSLIGIMMGSLSGVINIVFLPGISRKSDEFRSRWGRRIPFIAFVTPLEVMAVIMIGFAPEVGNWVYQHITHPITPEVALNSVILTWLCICIVAVHYLGMIFNNAFSWLMKDVVPQEFMARFLGWFRIISTVSGVAFMWYVFPYVISHRKQVCIGIGIFFLVSFLAMCWKVKEGEYPPVEPVAKKPGILQAFGGYFRSCISVPIYRNYFIAGMIGSVAACAGPFYLLFYRETLGIGMEDLGKIFAIGSIVTAVSYIPMGWLCDKFSPLKVGIVSQIGMFLMTLLAFFFTNDKPTAILFAIIGAPAVTCWALANATLNMQLFPSEKFGQFFAATSIFGCGIAILGNYLVGLFMDMAHSNYRMSYIWSGLNLLTLIPLLLVYRDWKRYGGPGNYNPPLPPE